jgi:C-5 cytosine-specific DNA methylase
VRVLDLFAGLGGWSAPFIERGHEAVTSDIDPRFGCTVTGDFLDYETRSLLHDIGSYDLILASPPCEAFSVASMGTHWGGGHRQYVPKTDKAVVGIALLELTVQFCEAEGVPFLIENPRGAMRKMGAVAHLPRHTVTYCQYGQRNMKPTDLFGKNSDPCHEAAPRGAKTGTQGIKGYAERSKIPYELALEVCMAMERHLSPTQGDESTA